MLDAEPEPSAPRPKSRAELGLEEIQRSLGGDRPAADRSATSHPDARRAPDPGPQLGAQLDALKTLYRTERRRDPRDNFRYIASRVLYYAENALPGQLGDERLFTPTEALASLSRF